MKKYLATAAVALIALTGCGEYNSRPTAAKDATAPSVKVGDETDLGGGYKTVRTAVVKVNGDDVTCVIYTQGDDKGGGGIDCDWENVTGEKR